MPDSQSSDNNLEGLSSLYSGALQNLSMLQTADNAVEAKLNAVVALALAALALLVQHTDQWHVLSYASAMLLFVSLALTLLGMRVRNYLSAVVSVNEKPEYLDMKSKDALLQLISDAELSYTDGFDKLDRKTTFYTWSSTLFVVAAIIAIVSFRIMNLGA